MAEWNIVYLKISLIYYHFFLQTLIKTNETRNDFYDRSLISSNPHFKENMLIALS